MLLFSLQSVAQNKYTKQLDVSKVDKEKVVFIDEFDTDDTGWKLVVFCEESSSISNPRAGVINYENGVLHYNKVDTSTSTMYLHKVDIDYAKDFRLEVRMRIPEESVLTGALKPESTAFVAVAISIGTELGNESKGMSCYIGKRGYSLWSYCYGTTTHKSCKKKWCRKKMIINKDEYNIYTIEKIKGQYFYFINGMYVFRKKYYPLSGNYIAIGGAFINNAKFDYIKVSYFPSL